MGSTRLCQHLGLLNRCDIHSTYSEGYNIIGHLQAASLLEVTEDSSQHLKMHDVIRDMAIWISCGCGKNNNKWVVHAAIGKTASRKCIPWNRVEYLSMMGNGLEELPYLGSGDVTENTLGSVRSKCWLGSCCTELRTLLLQDNMFSEKALGNIYLFTTLTYLDLSHNQIYVLPLALCALGDLEYLNLSYNYIGELPKDLQHLIKLKFLYLRGNPIRKGCASDVLGPISVRRLHWILGWCSWMDTDGRGASSDECWTENRRTYSISHILLLNDTK